MHSHWTLHTAVGAWLAVLSSASSLQVAPLERMRADYNDQCLLAPPAASLVIPAARTNFSSAELSVGSAYTPYVVDQGFSALAQAIRTRSALPLRLSSGYRDPRRNAAVGGQPRSVHQGGGAVDLVPVSGRAEDMVRLYLAALEERPALVLLESGPRQLLPGNWKPPVAGSSMTFGGVRVTLQDTDADGLVDRAETAPATPNARIQGMWAGVPLRLEPGSGRQRLVLVKAGTWRPLRAVFNEASHVHAQNTVEVEALPGCTPKP